MKAYVVLKYGWEYDDNWYTKVSYDDGRPTSIILDKDKAEARLLELTLKALDSEQQEYYERYYRTGWCEDLNLDEVYRLKADKRYDLMFKEMGQRGFLFYEIVEVEIEE